MDIAIAIDALAKEYPKVACDFPTKPKNRASFKELAQEQNCGYVIVIV